MSNKDGGESQPTEPSPCHTHHANTLAQPGLPDMPAPRHTSKQKHANEEQVRWAKKMKKSALKDAYQ